MFVEPPHQPGVWGPSVEVPDVTGIDFTVKFCAEDCELSCCVPMQTEMGPMLQDSDQRAVKKIKKTIKNTVTQTKSLGDLLREGDAVYRELLKASPDADPTIRMNAMKILRKLDSMDAEVGEMEKAEYIARKVRMLKQCGPSARQVEAETERMLSALRMLPNICTTVSCGCCTMRQHDGPSARQAALRMVQRVSGIHRLGTH